MIRQHRSTRVRLVTCAKRGRRFEKDLRSAAPFVPNRISQLPERRAVEIIYHTRPSLEPLAVRTRRADIAPAGSCALGTASSGHSRMQRRALAHIFLVGGGRVQRVIEVNMNPDPRAAIP